MNAKSSNFDLTMTVRLVLEGIAIGAVAGTFSSIYRYSLDYLEHTRNGIISSNITPATLGLWVAILFLSSIIVYYLLKWAPLSGGSGIPQIEGEIRGFFNMKPIKILLSKFFGGSLCSFAGFSMGKEGPSIQLGGACGKIISRLFARPRYEERILISAGAASGLTAAFSAPISGAIFVFEEIHKGFYPAIVIPTFAASMVSGFITSTIFGLGPSLGFNTTQALPLTDYWYLVALGIFMGLLGITFNKTLLFCQSLFKKVKINIYFKISFAFLIVGLVGFSYSAVLGGGNSLIVNLSHGRWALEALFILLVCKLLFTCFCYGSGVQGGIFLPILAIGASAGALMQTGLVEIGVMSKIYLANFMIAAMAALMASTVRCPLLAILLVTEMTKDFENIFGVGVSAIVAYIVAETFRVPPVYDSLLDRMLDKQDQGEQTQTYFDARISIVSEYINKKIEDLKLPEGTYIITIKRNGKSIVPTPSTRLKAQDDLYISCRQDKMPEIKLFFA